MEGILKHNYVNASDDIAAYQADKCGRQAVTVEYAFSELVDESLYVYRESDFDPWLLIDAGIDMLTTTEDAYLLCYGRTGEMQVNGDFRVFVSKKVLQKRGVQL